MMEAGEQPAQPLRTWRPMAMWSVGILLALGLCWFVAAVVPVWRTRASVQRCHKGDGSWLAEMKQRWTPAVAVRNLSTYMRLPTIIAPHKDNATEMMGLFGQAAIPELLRLTSDRDRMVRYEAVQTLAFRQSKDPEVVGALCRALKDEYEGVRWAAAATLGCIRSPLAVNSLIEALQDENKDVRVWSALALGHTKDIRANGPLRGLLNDNSSDVKRAAAEALAEISDNAPVKSPPDSNEQK